MPSGLVAFTVLGVDDNSSKMPLLLAYSPVAQPRAGRAITTALGDPTSNEITSWMPMTTTSR